MNKNYYVNIPKNIFTGENKLSNEELVIYLLLYRHLTIRNSFIFTINKLLEFLRVSINQTKMKDKIKLILLNLQNKGMFKIYFRDKDVNILDDFLSNCNEIYYAYLNENINYNIDCVKIYDKEIDRILEYCNGKKNIDKYKLISYFCYLTIGLNCNNGVYKPLPNQTIVDLSIGKKAIESYSEILRNLKLINFIGNYNEKVNGRLTHNLKYYYRFDSNKDILKKIEEIKDVKSKNDIKINNFTEEKLEDYLVNNLNKIEKGLTLIKRQYQIENGVIDILARDKNNKLCIIELKIVSDDKGLIYQCAYYPTQFKEETRIITIAPKYNKNIKESLKALGGIELLIYKNLDFKENEVKKLLIDKF